MSFGNHAINPTGSVRLRNHNRSLMAAIAMGAHLLIDLVYSLFLSRDLPTLLKIAYIQYMLDQYSSILSPHNTDYL